MSTTPPITCPSCGAVATENLLCRQCNVDLSILYIINAVPDVWFNRAVESVQSGDWGKALEWVSACCVARPADASAHRMRAKIWGQLQHPIAARESLELARALEPDHPDLKVIATILAAQEARKAQKLVSATKRGKINRKRKTRKRQ